MNDLRVRSIVVYPVKSCRGVSVARARVERRGLALDRRWMVVDARGRFVSQREAARLSLVDVAVEGEHLRLSAPGLSGEGTEVVVPTTLDEGPSIEVEIWERRVQAVVHGVASAWMSDLLSLAVRVVHLPNQAASPLTSRHARQGDAVSFADGYPLLIATEESLADLGARITSSGGQPVSMDRFRPNVVVSGAPAWDEDGWRDIALGDVSFRAPKACDRCVVTTIDPRTAKAGPEPLRTLATFRKRDGAVWFGVNIVPDTEGEIALGDRVRILARV